MAALPTMFMLPVANREHSETFYAQVFEWSGNPIGPDAVQLSTGGSVAIILVETSYLAQESGISPAGPALAPIAVVGLADQAAVTAIVERAVQAGGAVTSPARERDFGIFSAYFTDPDGNAWEALSQPTG